MDAAEYAKVEAVKLRVFGLRMAMVAVGLVGVATSVVVFLLSLSAGLLGLRPTALGEAVQLGLVVLVPFMIGEGYLSYRVNRHIDRLSKGKFEPPRIVE